jgi:hypothetical protein
MRKIYLFLIFMFVCLNFFSQTNKKQIDTSEICIPYGIAQKILLDLNDYDKLKEVIVTYKNEVYELNNKVVYLKKENEGWVTNEKLNKEVVLEKNKTIDIYKSENENLKKENKRLKTKNGLIIIISAVIITPLTYISAFK